MFRFIFAIQTIGESKAKIKSPARLFPAASSAVTSRCIPEGGPPSPRREGEPLRVQPQLVTAQKQDGAHRLVLRAGRDAPVHRQVRQIVANRFGVNLRLGAALLADEVLEEAARPIHIATLGSIGGRTLSLGGHKPENWITITDPDAVSDLISVLSVSRPAL